jgi:hypothetical protein
LTLRQLIASFLSAEEESEKSTAKCMVFANRLSGNAIRKLGYALGGGFFVENLTDANSPAWYDFDHSTNLEAI